MRTIVKIDEGFEPDPEITEYVHGYAHEFNLKLDQPCGYTGNEIEARFQFLRSCETTAGNLIADLVQTEFPNCDFALIQSGKLRQNALIAPGELTKRFVANMLPSFDSIHLLQVPGTIFVQALENSVSQYPKLDGRFPTCGGFRIAFDPSEEPGNRIKELTNEEGEPLDLSKNYVIALSDFVAQGGDGFDCFVNGKGVKKLREDISCREVVDQFFSRTAPDYIETNESDGEVTQQRLEKFNVTEKSESGFPILKLQTSGRIRIIQRS